MRNRWIHYCSRRPTAPLSAVERSGGAGVVWAAREALVLREVLDMCMFRALFSSLSILWSEDPITKGAVKNMLNSGFHVEPQSGSRGQEITILNKTVRWFSKTWELLKFMCVNSASLFYPLTLVSKTKQMKHSFIAIILAFFEDKSYQIKAIHMKE